MIDMVATSRKTRRRNQTSSKKRVKYSNRFDLPDNIIERFAHIAKITSESITKEESRATVFDPRTIKMLRHVENFIKKHNLVVYGGTALNAILPTKDKFYDPEYDLPDWDFFSDDPVRHAISIADDIHEKIDVETFVTTAAHHGTYKVYADGIAVADITFVETELLDDFRKHALLRDNILYSGPDYLRMAAYLELSRPRGQVERWEKVMQRISLLNRSYPIHIRDFKKYTSPLDKQTRQTILDTLINLQIDRKKGDTEFAFFGSESIEFLRKNIGKNGRQKTPELVMNNNGMFPMILTSNLRDTNRLVLKSIRESSLLDNLTQDDTTEKYTIVSVCRRGRGEFLPKFNEIRLGKKGPVLCLIIGTMTGCQSVYRLKTKILRPGKTRKTEHEITIASVESCIYMYMAIRFAKILPLPASAILKVCDRLIRTHHKLMNTNKKPVLPLPSMCVGTQETIKDMRREKQTMIKEILSEKKGRYSAEYFLWNIKYNGGDKKLRDTILRALKKNDIKECDTKNKHKRKTLKKKKK